MGSDKALLPFHGGNLLEAALGKARQVSPKPIIVGDRELYSSFGDVIQDRFPGCGPLGGIHAALCATQTDLNLVLSVDVPLMTVDFLIWLAQLAVRGGESAFVPEAQGKRQPLCAVYRRAAKSVVEQALKMGDFKVDHICSLIPTRGVPEVELLAAGFSSDIFCNVNTRGDYEAIRNMQKQDPPASSESHGQ